MTGLRRKLALAGLIAVTFIGSLAALIPSIIPSQAVRQQVASQLSDLTGRSVSLRGDQALKVFPNLSIEVSDLIIEGDEPGVRNALMVAEGLEARVRLMPLLFGRLSLSSLTLVRPTIQLQRDESGEANWMLDGSGLMRALSSDGAAANRDQLTSVRVTSGTVSFVDAQAQYSEMLTGATLSIQWPSASARANLRGDGIWRGEAITFSVSLDQPTALTQPGSTSGVVASLGAAPLTLRFDGTVTPGAPDPNGSNAEQRWQMAGEIEASSPSLRSAARWLGQTDGLSAALGPLDLLATINARDNRADLTNVSMSVDGNEGEGVMTITMGDGAQRHPSVQGTLDFGELDISSYLTLAPRTSTVLTPGDWRFVSVPDVFSQGLSLDLRVATRQLIASALTFGEVAGSVLLTHERLVVGIADAAAYGGSLGGSLTIERGAGADPLDGASVALDVMVNRLQLDPFLSALVDAPTLAGPLSMNANLSGKGPTLDDVMRTVSGDIDVRLEDAIWNRFDLNALAQDDLEEADTAIELPGSTRIERLDAAATVAQGQLTIDPLTIETEQTTLTVNGEASLTSRDVSLTGRVANRDRQDDDPEPRRAFTVEGNWAQPIVRSLGAAP